MTIQAVTFTMTREEALSLVQAAMVALDLGREYPEALTHARDLLMSKFKITREEARGEA